MKKLTYLFQILLSIALFTSCSNDDNSVNPESERFISNLLIDKQNSYINGDITLTFDKKNTETVTVVSSNTNVIITPVSETEYKLSSTKLATGIITITSKKGEITQTDKVQVIFNIHGTTDYQIIEGLNLGITNNYGAILLLGEPDVKVPYTVKTISTTTGIETSTKYIAWHYLSKGFSISILESTNVIYDLTVYANAWQVVVGTETKQGSPYPHTIGTLGNINTGMLMSTIVTKFGVPTATNKLIAPTVNQFGYQYSDINTTLTGTQSAIFYFNSDNIDVYTGKSVDRITFY